MSLSTLRRPHLLSHKTFLRTLYSVKNSRDKVLSALDHANRNQLRVLLRLVTAVANYKILLTKQRHKRLLLPYKEIIREIGRNLEGLLTSRRDTILCVLQPLAPVLRYFLSPLFCAAEFVKAEPTGGSRSDSDSSSSTSDSDSDSDSGTESVSDSTTEGSSGDEQGDE